MPINEATARLIISRAIAWNGNEEANDKREVDIIIINKLNDIMAIEYKRELLFVGKFTVYCLCSAIS